MIRILRTRPQPLTGKACKDPAFPEHQVPFGKSLFRVAPHLIYGTISCKSAIIDCIGIDTSAIFKGGVIMRLATYVYNDKEQLGVVSENGDSMVSLDGLCPNSSMAELIRNFSPEMAEKIEAIRAEGETIPLIKIVLDSPLPNPPRGIICLGKNYRDHIREVAKVIEGESEVPEFPIYFSKLVDRSVGTGGIIPSMKASRTALTTKWNWLSSSGRKAGISQGTWWRSTSLATRSSTTFPSGMCKENTCSGSEGKASTAAPPWAPSSSPKRS